MPVFLPDTCGLPSVLRKCQTFTRKSGTQVKSEADQAIREVPAHLLHGSDKNGTAIQVAKTNTNVIPGGKHVVYTKGDFQDSIPPKGATIICNPPYGLRMGDPTEMSALYKSLGDFFKKKCTGSTAYVYFGNREWIKHIGLRSTWKKPLVNGQLDGRLVKYEMY